MAFVKKTWKDRIVQYANRRLLTKSGGEVEQVTVTRDEGTISEAGDQFNASNMNDLEQRIENAYNELSSTTCSAVKGSTMPSGFPLPTIFRYGKVVTVNFAVQFPAGSYANTDVIWTLSPKPVGTVRVLLTTGTLDLMNFTTDGNVKFNSNKTFNSATWVIGNFTYLTS